MAEEDLAERLRAALKEREEALQTQEAINSPEQVKRESSPQKVSMADELSAAVEARQKRVAANSPEQVERTSPQQKVSMAEELSAAVEARQKRVAANPPAQAERNTPQQESSLSNRLVTALKEREKSLNSIEGVAETSPQKVNSLSDKVITALESRETALKSLESVKPGDRRVLNDIIRKLESPAATNINSSKQDNIQNVLNTVNDIMAMKDLWEKQGLQAVNATMGGHLSNIREGRYTATDAIGRTLAMQASAEQLQKIATTPGISNDLKYRMDVEVDQKLGKTFTNQRYSLIEEDRIRKLDNEVMQSLDKRLELLDSQRQNPDFQQELPKLKETLKNDMQSIKPLWTSANPKSNVTNVTLALNSNKDAIVKGSIKPTDVIVGKLAETVSIKELQELNDPKKTSDKIGVLLDEAIAKKSEKEANVDLAPAPKTNKFKVSSFVSKIKGKLSSQYSGSNTTKPVQTAKPKNTKKGNVR